MRELKESEREGGSEGGCQVPRRRVFDIIGEANLASSECVVGSGVQASLYYLGGSQKTIVAHPETVQEKQAHHTPLERGQHFLAE